MSVAAVEAAPAATGAGAGTATPAATPATQPALAGTTDKPKGVLLAIAIVLLWLAGLAFFIALEGSRLLGEAATPDGAGFFSALIAGLGRVVSSQATAASSGSGSG